MSEELASSESTKTADDQLRHSCSSPNLNSNNRNWSTATTTISGWKDSAYIMESTKRDSESPQIDVANDLSHQSGDSVEFISTTTATVDQHDEVPLDFSMKKRKSVSGNAVDTRMTASPETNSSTSATTYGLMKAFLESRSLSPQARRNLDLENSTGSISPFASIASSTNRSKPFSAGASVGNLPLSMTTAVNVQQQAQQNLGAVSATAAAMAMSNRRHYFNHQQQLLQKSNDQIPTTASLDELETTNGDTNNHGDTLHSTAREMSTNGNGPTPESVISILAANAAAAAAASSTPPAFYPGAIHSPQNGHQQPTSNGGASRNSQKIQRPFKAYNPMDPMSALQVSAALAPSAIPFLNATLTPPTMGTSATAASPAHLLLSNPLTSPAATNSTNTTLPPLLNAQLLSQYRQYLINAQAAAAVAALRAKSNQHLQHIQQRQNHRLPMQQSHDATISMTTGLMIANSVSSQSPPQVTSTSHPHTAESSASSSTGSPPSPNTLANINVATAPGSSVIMTNRIRKASLQPTKSTVGTDRRISSGSGSGSGGSSFNGADEDDEDLHEDDDRISNRTSPTPSCASSTAPRRSLTGNGDAIGIAMEAGGDHKEATNGSMSKNENGASNGVASRRKGRSLPESLKDDAYWERRRKNNEAAKRSRDARRAKEDEIALRAALLEQENMRLRIEVAALKAETDKLRQMLLNT